MGLQVTVEIESDQLPQLTDAEILATARRAIAAAAFAREVEQLFSATPMQRMRPLELLENVAAALRHSCRVGGLDPYAVMAEGEG